MNLVGNLESEATADACGDWAPDCAAAGFTGQGNGVYLFSSTTIPAGGWEYKVAMGSWAENYGANFQQDGPNIALALAAGRSVRFYYDHKTHYIADNVNDTIYTVPGSFNAELGCPGDWQPECLQTLMSDVDGDGVFTFSTSGLPAGGYEFKVATNESWSNPNYGEGGGSANVAFTVGAATDTVRISFDSSTNVADRERLDRGAVARQQRRVGRAPPRLARLAVPDAGWRGGGGDEGHRPLPHVP